MSAGLLRLHADDNVLIVLHDIARGESIAIGNHSFKSETALSLGHKLAAVAIRKGDPVIKYGAPIGLAGVDIPQGAHIHLHNLVSQYTVIEDMEQ
ncbi:MAG: UxaA family hydrolase [Sphingomonadales bacterium]|nr:UxaA family hydrolase [Sphingomonadales bacterium]